VCANSYPRFLKMPKSDVSFLENCFLCSFPPASGKFSFSSVGVSGIDKYFREEAVNYSKEKLSKNYCFVLKSDPTKVVCAFSLSNDGIQKILLTNNARRGVAKRIPFVKAAKVDTFPAVLIGQFGVAEEFKGKKVGSDVLAVIKGLLSESRYLTACRFLLVDANKDAVKFYEKNGFKLVYKSEEEEKKAFKIKSAEELSTRFMRFDMKDAELPAT